MDGQEKYVERIDVDVQLQARDFGLEEHCEVQMAGPKKYTDMDGDVQLQGRDDVM